MALVMVLLGGFFIIPSLSLMSTGLNINREVEHRVLELYAADAGIEDGLWRIQNDELPDWLQGTWGNAAYTEDPYIPDPGDGFGLPDPIPDINDRSVEVSIEPIWVLAGLEELKGNGNEPHDELVTVGHRTGESDNGTKGVYQIGVIYDGSVGNLKLDRVGCWLPAGFEYVDGSSNLEQDSGEPYYCVPTTFAHNGGTAITWDFSPAVNYNQLPADGNQMVVTFEFTPNQNIQGSFSWTRTNRNDIYLSWDVAMKIYKITSTATSDSGKNSIITAYTSKKEFRMLGAALTGDYEAAGNTLMRDHDSEGVGKRERLYDSTTATIAGIPDDATIVKVFLYWSGWKCKPWDAGELDTPELLALPGDASVDQVMLNIKPEGGAWSGEETITGNAPQVLSNGDSHGWSYAYRVDVTDTVLNAVGEGFTGNGQYMVGHDDTNSSHHSYPYALYGWTDNHTGESIVTYAKYPLGSPMNGGGTDTGDDEAEGFQDEWAYAAWSVVVVYTSPSVTGHYLHIDDDFHYVDNDDTLIIPIEGFLAPQDVISDPEAARITCFVGEGDDLYAGDSLQVNGFYLSDVYNPWNNVWNSVSNASGEEASVDGVDIDTYAVAGSSGIISPGDIEAEVTLDTGDDSWNLVYIILSFRNQTTMGGYMSYIIEDGY